MKEITSLQNPLIKHLVELRKESGYRKEQKSVLISGYTMVKELQPVTSLFIEKGYEVPTGISYKTIYSVTREILEKITGLKNPEPIAAETSLPETVYFSSPEFLLVLDSISDPGNLGTLIRSTLALGWSGAFLINSADPFNEKALRAAKGATFRLPIQIGSYTELQELIQKKSAQAFVADIRGEPLNKKITAPIVLVLGNETHGPSEEIKKMCQPISIPMIGPMESLNVASAGSILLHALRGL